MVDFTSGREGRRFDVDGRAYVDFDLASGACILGHADADVDARVAEARARGDAAELAAAAALHISAQVASAEEVVLCAGGDEAIRIAVAAARAATGRRDVLAFTGLAPADALPGDFNDLDATSLLFVRCADEVAAVLVDPIMQSSGCVLPTARFLERLRALCTRHGSVLVFDERCTGMRHGLHGFEAICGVRPDLVVLGETIGNGHLVGAVCGPRELLVAAERPGVPAAAAAAVLATLDRLASGEVYDHIDSLGERLRAGLYWVTADSDIPAQAIGFGSVFALYFSERPVRTSADLRAADAGRARSFGSALVRQGFVLPADGRVCAAHTEADVDGAIEASAKAVRSLDEVRAAW